MISRRRRRNAGLYRLVLVKVHSYRNRRLSRSRENGLWNGDLTRTLRGSVCRCPRPGSQGPPRSRPPSRTPCRQALSRRPSPMPWPRRRRPRSRRSGPGAPPVRHPGALLHLQRRSARAPRRIAGQRSRCLRAQGPPLQRGLRARCVNGPDRQGWGYSRGRRGPEE